MSYTKVKNDLLRSNELKANAKILLLVLMSYENDVEGYSYPSQTRLLKETNLSKTTLLKCLNELERKGYIKRVKEKGENNKYYISSSIKIDTDTSIKNSTTTSAKNDTTTSTKNSTLKELNKNKKEKKENKTDLDKIIEAYTENDLLIEALKDFIKMRKAIKRPLTDRAMKGILNKLNSYGRDDLEKIEVLENSIVNCWQGIFPLKEVPTAIGGKRNNSFNGSMCNSNKNYTRGVEML